jgi:hypothetical protein
MKAADRLAEWGYEDVVIFENPSYDDALIGVTTDNRAVYDYELMVEWLFKNYGWGREDAVEWIEFNTIGSLSYRCGSPVIMQRFPE